MNFKKNGIHTVITPNLFILHLSKNSTKNSRLKPATEHSYFTCHCTNPVHCDNLMGGQKMGCGSRFVKERTIRTKVCLLLLFFI